MKKAVLILFCITALISTVSCDIKNENCNFGIHTSDAQTIDSNTTDTATPCAHIFGEWSISKEATEREDGETKRGCSRCNYFETKPIHAKGTKGLAFTLSEDGTSYSVSAGSTTDRDVFIPAYHNGLPVTSIGYIGFANSDVDPEDFEVGGYAFLSCSNLKTIVIPPTVTVIGDAAFMMCEGLERIVIPESVKEIGEYAFALTAEDAWSKYFDDIKITVPNSEVILILREWQVFTASGVEIYYINENGSEILIADTYFDNDGYCPFYNGNFEIINNNDTTFSVCAGWSSGKEDWIERTFDLPQCVSVFAPKIENSLAVFYGGNNSDEWNAINILTTGNTRLTKCVISYYSENEPNENNRFWHYVDGIPTVW